MEEANLIKMLMKYLKEHEWHRYTELLKRIKESVTEE